MSLYLSVFFINKVICIELFPERLLSEKKEKSVHDNLES